MDTVHLSQKHLAARWRVAEATLERWRSDGLGPQYLKINPDGQFKFPHLWPVKLPHGGRPDYDESPVTAMRAAASLSR